MGRSEPWGLVLAGGDGTRLRELTTLIAGAPIPKQYCRIDGDRSLLAMDDAPVGGIPRPPVVSVGRLKTHTSEVTP